MRTHLKLVIAAIAAVGLVAGAGSAKPAPIGGTSAPIACGDGQVTYSPTSIWPPNHKMQTVDIYYADTDNDGDQITITVGNITDNQIASDGTEEVGSGQPTDQQGPDWAGTGNTATATDPGAAHTTAQVRAERSGTDKAGRTYDIQVTCTETGGNNSSDSAEQGSNVRMQTVDLLVHVPHDRGH